MLQIENYHVAIVFFLARCMLSNESRVSGYLKFDLYVYIYIYIYIYMMINFYHFILYIYIYIII